MSFDLDALRRAVDRHGQVARVLIAEVHGSAPREVGTAMLVWADGQSGTIGGGALEYEAAAAARTGKYSVARRALGPALGQCCGGAVTLVTEIFDAARLAGLDGPLVVRRVEGQAEMPLAMSRAEAEARNAGAPVETRLQAGWLIEPVAVPTRPLWIFGAGHVGRALVDVLAPLPEFAITWVDTAQDRFPAEITEGVTPLIAANPADVVQYAPANAEHLVLTYSHALDLELCHRLLGHGFATAGLIGSATKWARFRKRLRELGHGESQIARIQCPIGNPAMGKHPQAIAIGVAGALLAQQETMTFRKKARA